MKKKGKCPECGGRVDVNSLTIEASYGRTKYDENNRLLEAHDWYDGEYVEHLLKYAQCIDCDCCFEMNGDVVKLKQKVRLKRNIDPMFELEKIE